ncbi:MAG: lon2 [Myxococcales bacterium]|nr:lon2 [Myxococcales bacterium]
MAHPFLDELKREVVLRPDDPAARYRLAEALFADGDFTTAARQLERAVKLDGTDANARRLLAKTYERAGRGPDALRTLEELAKRTPDDVSTREELTELFLAQGRVDDALVHAEEAARLSPTDPKRHRAAADLYRMKRLLPQAKEALERAQRLVPEDPHIAAELRELYLELGDDAASERVAGVRDRSYFLHQARTALATKQLARETSQGTLKLAAEALAAGDTTGVKRALVAAAPSEKSSAAYEFLRGEVLLIDGETERAERAFRSCTERAVDFGLAYNRLGDLLQHRGALRDAVALYELSIRHSPDDANAYEDLGDVYATLGEREKALEMYRAAADRDPKSRAADKLRSLDDAARAAAATEPAIGKIGVLGWTPSGGAVSPLEAVAVVGQGQLIFSGNVGPTSREAGLVAFSCLKYKARDLGIGELVSSYDLHLHFTDTEVGKDGPSSGLALVLAGISAYQQRPLRAQLAATGEITIHGEVKAVGGIHEKIVAARLAGFRTVLMPRRNIKEARELPSEVASKIEIIFVDTVAEAVAKALVG